MADLHKAIYNIHTNVKGINGDTQETITAWDENNSLVDIDWSQVNAWVDPDEYKYKRLEEYPSILEFVEAYTEKEIGGDTTKWDEYVIKYNKVRTDNPK
jgi:hypothetical protein|tara:strand:+ start:215 stop:511 length:297 start_codon:yes stop_codon:yes gene_type:complete